MEPAQPPRQQPIEATATEARQAEKRPWTVRVLVLSVLAAAGVLAVMYFALLLVAAGA